MHKHTCLIVLALALGQVNCQERAEKAEDKLRVLQGRWVLVEAYSAFPKADGGREVRKEVIHKPEEVEFIGKIGIVRDILKDGSRDKPATFCVKVDVSTNPISFDVVSFPVRPRGELFFIGVLKVEKDKLYLAYSPDLMTRPKSFASTMTLELLV